MRGIGPRGIVVRRLRGNERRFGSAARREDLLQAGLLLGHHAHVVQPVENVDGEWVVYGMGNMLANQRQPERSEGLLTKFTFTQIGPTWRVTSAGFEPLVTVFAPQVRLLTVDEALANPATDPALQPRLVEARDRTTSIVDQRGALAAGLTT